MAAAPALYPELVKLDVANTLLGACVHKDQWAAIPPALARLLAKGPSFSSSLSSLIMLGTFAKDPSSNSLLLIHPNTGLVTHENTDISIAALGLLGELTDPDVVLEAEKEAGQVGLCVGR